MATMQDSRVTLRVDQNGAEELTPAWTGDPGARRGNPQVMSPFLPDEERADRLAELRQGQIELTVSEKLVLKTAKSMMEEGKKVTARAMYQALKGEVAQRQIAYTLKSLRELDLLATPTEDDVATSEE
jgi:hypothetical protein